MAEAARKYREKKARFDHWRSSRANLTLSDEGRLVANEVCPPYICVRVENDRTISDGIRLRVTSKFCWSRNEETPWGYA
jgi:hypothetical protein